MGDLMSQPSGRSRLTELARRWAHRSPNRATAVRSVPVLSAAPPIRVAHTRHASAHRTGDPFARKLIPVHTCMRSDVAGARRGTRVRDQTRRPQMRANPWQRLGDRRATILSEEPVAQERRWKMILKEPHARAV